MAITRYSPWQVHGGNMHEEIRNVFDRFFNTDETDQSNVVTSQWTPRVDIKEEDTRFVIFADIPGVDSKDIEITMEKGILSIKGERKAEATGQNGKLTRSERSHGLFYRRFALPHSGYVLRGLSDAGVPRIHFGVGTHHLLRAMTEAGADVIGLDWRTPLDTAVELVGPGVAVQGNLDPAVLFAPWSVIEGEVRQVLAAGRAAGGHVFNLGHGVLPETDPDILTRVVALVHELSAR